MSLLLLSGLNPIDMMTLMYKPFDENSPLQITTSLEEDVVKDVRFIQFCMHFLEDLQASKYYKLTQKGNLIRKVLHRLYDYRLYTSDWIDEGKVKILQEEDFSVAHFAHMLLRMGGVVRKQHNKLLITKKGEKLMKNKGKLYLQLFQAYTTKLNWSYHTYDPDEVIQIGWAYTMYQFIKHGKEERPVEFYAEAYLEFVPNILMEFTETYSTPKEQFLGCFRRCFFSRFNGFFEFAEIQTAEGKYKTQEISTVKKSPLADKLFSIKN